MKAQSERTLDMGAILFTPLTDISWLAGGASFYYAYVDGPDHALIELNTAGHHHFGHLHLLSEDPIETGEWYMKHFGATRRGNRPPSREERFHEGVQYAPSMSLMMDNVNIIVYPIQYSRGAYKRYWEDGQAEIAPTKGRVVDHVAFSVDNLPEALERLRRDGVKVTGEIRATAGGKLKSAFIEGPDHLRIEVVEGHAHREP